MKNPVENSATKQGILFSSRLFQGWLRRRSPPSGQIILNQKNIFIMPTREGLAFILLLVFMVLAAINYQNSLIFAFAFLLGSLFVIGILHTFRNLSGLSIQAGSVRPAFAGEDAEFTVIISRDGKRIYEAIHLGWPGSVPRTADLITEEKLSVRLYVVADKRGILKPGRLQLQTFYPLGLLQAWSWVDLDMSVVIYPKPIYAGPIPASLASVNEGELLNSEGVDDFYGLRDYNLGDALRHVAWKSYARTGDIMIKQYAAYVDRRVWLDWNYFAGMDTESRLSRLSYWVVQLSGLPDEYGLRLPGIEIQPARGDVHRENVLKTLALYEIDPDRIA